MDNNIKIKEIEDVFKDVFNEEEGLVRSVDTVYEMSPDEDFYKLVISIHGLSIEDTFIVHTKFIFKTDLEKKNIIDDSFIYLYDINCVYHKIEFSSIMDMSKKIEDIVESRNFGEDILIISDFIESPAMFINHYLRWAKITEYSVFDVEYSPKFKHQPCDKTTFDFKININNNYNVDLSIRKIENENEEETNLYRFQFKFMDEIETKETETLSNIHFFIGSNLAKILDKKLKNK
jgi:hypothetical protein